MRFPKALRGGGRGGGPCYVAAEAGVSDRPVHFLDALPLGEAPSALTLFWGGIALGRLVCA